MKEPFGIITRIRTPLMLAALCVIVLFLISKAVLDLKIFGPLEPSATVTLINSIIDRLFYLALTVVVFALPAPTIFRILEQQLAQKNPPQRKKRRSAFTEFSTQIAGAYAHKTSEWFSIRYAQLQLFASEEELKTNSKLRHSKILPRISQEVDGFPGGIYTLNECGVVICQSTPYFPTMPDITGYEAGHKEYFLECQRQQKPIVCNSFRSANRWENILVVAVPRYSIDGQFIGILDAVVDLCSAPFSILAKEVLQTVPPGSLKGKRLNVYLLDNNHIVLGSNHSKVGKGLGGNRVVEEILNGNTDPAVTGDGATCEVEKTPFHVVAYFD